MSCRNYYLLILFFGVAALYSILDVRRQHSIKGKHRMQTRSSVTAKQNVNGLGYFVITLFHINLTVCMMPP